MKNLNTPLINNIDWGNFVSDILPHVEEGIAALDTYGRVLYCNTSFLTMTRKTAEQVQGQELKTVFNEQATAKWHYHETATKEIIYQQQAFQLKLIPSFTALHEQKGCAVVIKKTDYTSTKHPIYAQVETIDGDDKAKSLAQEKLRYKEQLIENMLSSFPVVLSRIDNKGIIQAMAGLGLQNVGVENNQLVGYNILEQDEQIAPYIRKVLSGEKASFIFEYDHKGRKKYFQCFYFYDKARECANGFSIDITDQKEAEEKLKQSEAQLTTLNGELEFRVEERTKNLSDSEERYRSLIIAAASIVWTADSEGEMTEENKQWEQFTGQTWEQYQQKG